MTSLPGVLTAAAGLVTAVTGGGLYLSSGDQTDPLPGNTYIHVDGAPVPEVQGEVDAADLETGLSEVSGGDEVTILANDCLDGYYDACDSLLVLLADHCQMGVALSCDDLFLISEYGSVYEDYGATCGGRLEDWTYAGVCSSGEL